MSWWEESFETYRAALEKAGDRDLQRVVEAPWAPAPGVRTVLDWSEVLIHENAHHGGEIGCLRDLFRITQGREDNRALQ